MKWLVIGVVVATVGWVVAHEPQDWRQKRTPPTRCVPPNHCFPSRQVIAEFAGNLTGSVYQPSDAAYAGLVSATNPRLVRHPSILVQAATEDDVIRSVLFARTKTLHY